MPEFSGTKDLRSYFTVLWRWKWLFLAFLVAAPVIAYVIKSGERSVYSSTALVGVSQTTVDTSAINGGGSFSTTNVQAIAELVNTTPVAEVAAGFMRPHPSPSQIAGEVSATADPITNFLKITAQDPSPDRAAAIANAFARAIALNRQNAAIQELDNAIAGFRAQLRHSHGPARTQLQAQVAQLRAARSTQGSNAAILQAAVPSSTPVGLNARRSVEIGLLIGLLLAIGAVVLAESADRRLRTPDDLEGMTDLPLLGNIGPSAFSERLETTTEDEEAFQMLRTSLTFYNVDRSLRSVVITSAGEQDGKTTVATRLALATARAGQNVILVDADLRRARVSARLEVKGGGGLAEVLAGHMESTEALVEKPVDAIGGGRLMVLPAGRVPPNPSGLLSSERMRHVLSELEEQSDLVIIDTPAALAVSDPMPLMRLVSGVVLIARMNRSSRQRIHRLQKMIESAHGTLLGVVATGVGPTSGYYEHYSTKYYAQNGNGHTAKPWGRVVSRRRQPESR